MQNNKAIQMSDQEKLKAAYALNLCMVSVSQIIDYNDLYILEQEYDAILNNLNLENMPKDEAFLDILKQLLDTITFFRIHEGNKKIIQKEYQQKMKNAIWSAVPNLGLLVAGGSPLTMAVSLATQVGIGYMNYRKAKASHNLEKETREWELQRSAIEQFNGLRRELFNTAWQISAQYQFPDEYRLTEKQINQYNNILMDTNYLRRYDRLDTIKSKFKAYPPFWYFFGNTAAIISNDERYSNELRKSYKEKAVEHFEQYCKTNCYNLLREDQITASWALEYIDLLDCDKDKEKINTLIDIAKNMSGNENDVLQLCAIASLKVGNFNQATDIMRTLVNEDYNKEMNAQLLSKLYISDYIENNNIEAIIAYEILKSRADNTILMPMPNGDEDIKAIEEKFYCQQKQNIKIEFGFIYLALIAKYTVMYNKIIHYTADKEESYYFDIIDEVREKRVNDIEMIFSNSVKKKRYLSLLSEKSLTFETIDLINKLLNDLFLFSFIKDETKTNIINSLTNTLKSYSEIFEDLENKILDGIFSINDYKKFHSVKFDDLLLGVDTIIEQSLDNHLKNVNDMFTLTQFELELKDFRISNNLPKKIYESELSEIIINTDYLSYNIFRSNAEEVRIKKINFNKMKQQVIDMSEEITVGSTANFLIHGTDEFRNYVEVNGDKHIKNDTFAIFDVEGNKDLAFTLNGIRQTSSGMLTTYNLVECKGHQIRLDSVKFKADNINSIAFEELCQMLYHYSNVIEDAGFKTNLVSAATSTATMVSAATFGIAEAFSNLVGNAINNVKEMNSSAKNAIQERNNLITSEQSIGNLNDGVSDEEKLYFQNFINSESIKNATQAVRKKITPFTESSQSFGKIGKVFSESKKLFSNDEGNQKE